MMVSMKTSLHLWQSTRSFWMGAHLVTNLMPMATMWPCWPWKQQTKTVWPVSNSEAGDRDCSGNRSGKTGNLVFLWKSRVARWPIVGILSMLLFRFCLAYEGVGHVQKTLGGSIPFSGIQISASFFMPENWIFEWLYWFSYPFQPYYGYQYGAFVWHVDLQS